GFVLGFAFKDILSHFLAGILLLAGRTFQIGDQIAVKEFEGTVEAISLRATNIRTYDNRLVIVPNADVFTSAVTNNTQSRVRRQEFDIGIDYDADIAEAQLIAFRTMKEMKGVMEDPAPDVLVAELAASWITLRCRFWSDSRRANVLAVGSEVRRKVKEAFDEAGIYLPFDVIEHRMGPHLYEPVTGALAALAASGGDGNGHARTKKPLRPVPPSPAEPTKEKSEAEQANDAAKAEAALPQSLTAEAE
ncbi:MAG: mechanosensitive ion channel family protein, partial [Armatimonadetes bacterium]|nr:mechanosensitive ion channel family protein [Armatimonadota bacterium]